MESAEGILGREFKIGPRDQIMAHFFPLQEKGISPELIGEIAGKLNANEDLDMQGLVNIKVETDYNDGSYRGRSPCELAVYVHTANVSTEEVFGLVRRVDETVTSFDEIGTYHGASRIEYFDLLEPDGQNLEKLRLAQQRLEEQRARLKRKPDEKASSNYVQPELFEVDLNEAGETVIIPKRK